MSALFQTDVYRAISGLCHPHFGITLPITKLYPWQDWEAVERHEYIHIDLIKNSIYGYFQRQLFILLHSDIVPDDHKIIYKVVFKKMLDNSKVVHEGIATYRELLWYKYHTNNANSYLKSLPKQYYVAYQFVEKILPLNIYLKGTPGGLHAICNVLGCYLLNAPIPVYYKSWKRLQDSELMYITKDSPDDRLKKLIGDKRKKCVSKLLSSELKIVSQILNEREKDVDRKLGDKYWEWFDKTLLSLREIRPYVPVCGLFERNQILLEMYDAWKSQINSDYSSFFGESLSQFSDNLKEEGFLSLISSVNFANFRAGKEYSEYDNLFLDEIDLFKLKYMEILNRGNIPFIFIDYANPTNEDIFTFKKRKLEAESVGGFICELNNDEIEKYSISVKNNLMYSFKLPLISFLELDKNLPCGSGVNYISSEYYKLLKLKGIKLNNLSIINVKAFDHFENKFVRDQNNCYLAKYDKGRSVFIHYNDDDKAFKFFIINDIFIDDFIKLIVNISTNTEGYILINGVNVNVKKIISMFIWAVNL